MDSIHDDSSSSSEFVADATSSRDPAMNWLPSFTDNVDTSHGRLHSRNIISGGFSSDMATYEDNFSPLTDLTEGEEITPEIVEEFAAHTFDCSTCQSETFWSQTKPTMARSSSSCSYSDYDVDEGLSSSSAMTTGRPRGRKSLSEAATKVLTSWILEHQDDPYPNQTEKEMLARRSGLTVKQVVDWMTNMRKRRLHPVIT